MTVQDAVQVGRSLAVMVRVQGPDPKRLKMRNHAFHKYDSGNTTLSASAMLLPHSLYDAESAKSAFGENVQLIVTVASVIEPFLSLQQRMNEAKGRPELIPGGQISILMEDNLRVENNCEADNGAPNWIPAQLLTFVDVLEPALALQSLLHASSSTGGHGWEIGWSLASQANINQPTVDLSVAKRPRQMAVEESGNPSTMGKSLTKIAILGVALSSKVLPGITLTTSSMMTRGDSLIAVASPFGILSPMHFLNSISRGSIANCYPPNSPSKSLLIADIRCLPGMEGGPVLDENAGLVGILSRPLCQENSGAEVQLLIPWEAIATACNHALLNTHQRTGNNHKAVVKEVNCYERSADTFGRALLYSNSDQENRANHSHKDPLVRSPSAYEKAMASVCLVTIDDRLWASGILLNEQGLVLTNAHLLEPWRFGRTHLNRGREPEVFSLDEKFHSPVSSTGDGHGENNSMDPRIPQKLNVESTIYSGHKRIRVRLFHTEPWVWCDAKEVRVCKGPLDIALLQLVDAPGELSPVMVDFTSPPPGSRAYVIGHGLFGPRCGFMPSISSGVVAKVVNAKLPEESYSWVQMDKQQGEFPAMLETTAAVHPGASGGLVVNSQGYMIGLITSNARHGGGTIIPHLNFSIPSAALAPIFKFSQDMENVSVLQDLDQPNKNFSRVWELIPPLSQKPGPMRIPGFPPQSLAEGGGEKEEGKGSRFAKFMIENNLLKEPTLRLRGEEERKPSGRSLPSKL